MEPATAPSVMRVATAPSPASFQSKPRGVSGVRRFEVRRLWGLGAECCVRGVGQASVCERCSGMGGGISVECVGRYVRDVQAVRVGRYVSLESVGWGRGT